MALKVKPEMSNRAIADHCGVSDPFVADIRSQLLTVSSSDEPEVRIGADGKARRLPTKPPAETAEEEELGGDAGQGDDDAGDWLDEEIALPGPEWKGPAGNPQGDRGRAGQEEAGLRTGWSFASGHKSGSKAVSQR